MTTPCLYSIVRYAPYAETEEFANIGVLLCAPKENYFDFQLTKRNDSRVKNFFHDDCIFPVAKDSIQRELQFACDPDCWTSTTCTILQIFYKQKRINFSVQFYESDSQRKPKRRAGPHLQ